MARHFSNWLEAYMRFSATASEAPLHFHFWVGIATVAGALRSCVWVDELSYKITPNFYLFLVAPPGIATKSTTVSMGMRLLDQVPDIRFGPSSVTWQALIKTFQESIITVKWIDPKTGEERLRPASCLTLDISELGTFLKMGAEGFVDNLVDWWDGKISKRAWTHRTLMSGSEGVQNPWINIIAATTPSWLQSNFPEGMVGGGFTSRILFVFGDSKRQLIHRPSQYWPTDDYEDLEQKLVEDLTSISKLRGPVSYSPEGDAWMKQWYETHWKTVPAHMASVRYEGYRSRKQTHLIKVAMVLAAARSDDLTLTRPLLEEALEMTTTAEASMIRVFESIGIVDQAHHIRELVGFVRNYSKVFPNGIPVSNLWRLCYNIMSLKDFQTACVAAVDARILKKVAATGEWALMLNELQQATQRSEAK